MAKTAAQKERRLTLDINLLPGKNFEKSSIGKFLKWALSVGRYIVIFTELIVILAFLARFKLDRDIADLHDEIEQKKIIVESARGLEDDYKKLQFKIGEAKKIIDSQEDYREILNKVGVMTPVDAVVETFTMNNNSFTLKAQVFSDAGLATFISEFKNSPYFSEVNLGTITKGEDGVVGTRFLISGKVIESAGVDNLGEEAN